MGLIYHVTGVVNGVIIKYAFHSREKLDEFLSQAVQSTTLFTYTVEEKIEDDIVLQR